MKFTFIKQKAQAVLMAAVLAICGIFAGSEIVFAEDGSVYPEHEPYGTGVGTQPGRVVWFHDKDSVDWDGNGYWWNIGNFNEEIIQKMVDESIASLAGEEDVGVGWTALFSANNSARGRTAAYAREEIMMFPGYFRGIWWNSAQAGNCRVSILWEGMRGPLIQMHRSTGLIPLAALSTICLPV